MDLVIETRLVGAQATLAGVTRFVNRQMLRGPFARVELRYSTQTAQRVAADEARDALKRLLREHGMAGVAVSVRAHEGALDDATGEHLVRLYPAEPRGAAEDDVAKAMGAGSWRAWLQRLWSRQPATRAGIGATAATRAGVPAAAAPQAEPPVPRAQAVAVLREALAAAVRQQAADTIGPWSGAEVVVRLPALDAALRPLVAADAARAAASLAAQLRVLGQAAAPGFAVRYAFREPAAGEGTSYASECDVEVLLRRDGGQPSAPPTADPRIEPTLMPASPVVASTMATLLPSAPKRPAVTLTVTGTLAADFERPLVLHFHQLPAVLDRDALARAGLGAIDARLLAVASQSAKLRVQVGAEGRLQVLADSRQGPGGPMPMYFARRGGHPLAAQQVLSGEGLEVVVNDPAGVVGADGQVVPALVVRVTAG